MKKFAFLCLILFVIGVATSGALALMFYRAWYDPGDFDQQQTLIVKSGSTATAVAQQVKASGFFTAYDVVYRLILHFNPLTIKAGEYALPPHSSLRQVFAILGSGQVIRRGFTIPEGLTVKQIIGLLDNGPLPGDGKTPLPPEGSLLPDTYLFTHDDTQTTFLDQMSKAQTALLTTLWQARDPAIPLTAMNDAITLASIVEKETGIPSERAKIAGLFYNRLRMEMLLQSDPTVVYAITDGLGSMQGRRLYAKDLQADSPYNTYKYAGLPPGPICNPGRASLEAVLHPAQHDYVYFVADGTGGHVFAKTLEEHNANVQAWRAIRRARESGTP